MHELAHIVLGHQGIYLDNLDALEDNDKEKEADEEAANWLIETQPFKVFISGIETYFSRKVIEEFAYTQRRYTGIILGRLQHDKLVPHKNLRPLYHVRLNTYNNVCSSAKAQLHFESAKAQLRTYFLFITHLPNMILLVKVSPLLKNWIDS